MKTKPNGQNSALVFKGCIKSLLIMSNKLEPFFVDDNIKYVVDTCIVRCFQSNFSNIDEKISPVKCKKVCILLSLYVNGYRWLVCSVSHKKERRICHFFCEFRNTNSADFSQVFVNISDRCLLREGKVSVKVVDLHIADNILQIQPCDAAPKQLIILMELSLLSFA